MISENKKTLEDLDIKLLESQNKNTEYDNKIKDLEKKISELKLEEDKINKKIKTNKDKIVEQSQAMTSKEAELAKITKEIIDLNKYGDTRVKEAQGKLDKVIVDKEKLEKLKDIEIKKKKELIGSIGSLDIDNTTITTELEVINSNINKINSDIKEKENEIISKNKQIATLKETNGKYEDQLAQLKIENERLIKLVKDLETQITNLALSNKKELDEINNKIKNSETSNTELQANIKNLNAEIVSLDKAKEGLIAKLSKGKTDGITKDSEIVKLKGDISKIDLEVSNLNSDIDKLNIQIKDGEKGKVNLNSQVAGKTSEITKLKNEQEKLKKDELELKTNLNKINATGKALYNAGLRRLERDFDYSAKTMVGVSIQEAKTLLDKIKTDEVINSVNVTTQEKTDIKNRITELEQKIIVAGNIQEQTKQIEDKQMSVTKSFDMEQLEGIQKDIKAMPESYDKNRLLEMLYWMEEIAVRDIKVVKISLGAMHSAAITDTGKLYTWGRGEFGRLGHGDKVSQPTPKQVDFFKGKKVKEVSLGSSHSSAITEDGQLYTWGYGDSDRLGHGDTNNQTTPKQVEYFTNLIK